LERTLPRSLGLGLVALAATATWGCSVSGEREPLEAVQAVAAVASAAPARGEPVTLVTYNVHSFFGTDGRYDLERIAAVIRETRPDIVALQEYGDFRGRIPADAPERLARLLDMPLLFGPTVTGEGRFGNAILTRFPVKAVAQYDLTAGLMEPRKALRADLELAPGVVLKFVCVHLGLVPLERGAQVRAFGRRVLGGLDGPLVVCGDFNHWFVTRDRPIENAGLADVAETFDKPENTFPSGGPFFRLDRVYTNRLVRPLGIHVHRSERSGVASDHLPLVCRFEVPPEIR
jgi:endonuclease/exonuclease/phosphatase family metal-dependent hydrolase